MADNTLIEWDKRGREWNEAPAIADRPILFSAPMVRALLAGTKTQTRRVLKPQPELFPIDDAGTPCDVGLLHVQGDELPRVTTGRVITGQQIRFATGDRLWVREAYFQRGHWEAVPGERTKGGRQKWAFVPDGSPITFDAPAEFRKCRHSADPGAIAWHKRLGRFMPRWASRLTLTVTDVRVERLQAITADDCRADGHPVDWVISPDPAVHDDAARDWYWDLWDEINGPGAWDENPWVVAVSFTVARGNIDQVAA